MQCRDATMLQFSLKTDVISMETSIASSSTLDMTLNDIVAVISWDYATTYCSLPYDFNGALNCNIVRTVHSNNALVDADDDMVSADA
jgi:hypothetical protein